MYFDVFSKNQSSFFGKSVTGSVDTLLIMDGILQDCHLYARAFGFPEVKIINVSEAISSI